MRGHKGEILQIKYDDRGKYNGAKNRDGKTDPKNCNG